MSADDQERYQSLQEQQARQWEAACRKCGACCGAVEGDPCEFLRWNETGRSLCQVYDNRLGLKKTRSGREFLCVPLRTILHKSWPGDQGCAYKRKIHYPPIQQGIISE